MEKIGLECCRGQTVRTVEQAREVLDIVGTEIVDAPTLGTEINTDYILGIGKSEGHVSLLLDIDKIFQSAELADLGMAA